MWDVGYLPRNCTTSPGSSFILSGSPASSIARSSPVLPSSVWAASSTEQLSTVWVSHRSDKISDKIIAGGDG